MKSMNNKELEQHVENKKKFAELEAVSQPVVEFLNKYYDPMAIAIITEGRVDVYTGSCGMPLEVRD